MNLFQFFLDNERHSSTRNLHYLPVFERFLGIYRGRASVLFEISDGARGSPEIWKRFLGPFARIVSIERDPSRAAAADEQISVRYGSVSDAAFLARLIEEFGQPDMVVDDGSHQSSDVINNFEALYPHVCRNGFYLVEDLYTAYWDEYGGGLRAGTSFLDYVKDLIDELHADHTRGRIPPTGFSRNTLAIHLYDSLAVFERGTYLTRRSIETGPR